MPAADVKPRLRGVSHAAAFVPALPAGIALALYVDAPRERAAAIAFAVSVAVMFAASGLYHRGPWSDVLRRWLRALDHAGIFMLIAGTYTAFALLVLDGPWAWGVPAAVWAVAIGASVVNAAWPSAPGWLTGVVAVGLGWVGVAVAPQLLSELGAAGGGLLLAGGLSYTAGAAVFMSRRPDPFPATFGYHEVFHVLVIVAVACHYVAVAFFAIPRP